RQRHVKLVQLALLTGHEDDKAHQHRQDDQRVPHCRRQPRGNGDGLVRLAHGLYPRRADSYTSRKATPFSRASRAQSSYSGAKTSTPSRQPRLPRTSPQGVWTLTLSRCSFDRSIIVRRTPSVAVSEKRIASNSSRFSMGDRTLSSTPGRCFFIWIAIE